MGESQELRGKSALGLKHEGLKPAADDGKRYKGEGIEGNQET